MLHTLNHLNVVNDWIDSINSQFSSEVVIASIVYFFVVFISDRTLGAGRQILAGILIVQALGSFKVVDILSTSIIICTIWALGVLCTTFTGNKVNNSPSFCIGLSLIIPICTLLNNLRIIQYSIPFVVAIIVLSVAIYRDFKDILYQKYQKAIRILKITKVINSPAIQLRSQLLLLSYICFI